MGGKAFDGQTRPIQIAEVQPTLDWLEKHWPDHTLNWTKSLDQCLLGSGGKKEISGDLDLNLDIAVYDQGLVSKQIIAVLGSDNVKPRPGHNQIFTAVPIAGDEKNGRVQVDFMFGLPAWQAFSYHSPSVSAFKGLYRTELIKALVAFNSDWISETDGELVARVGPTFFHDRGCVWRYRYRPLKKDGSGRIKAFKEVTKDEFLEIFPGANIGSHGVISDPAELSKLLIGRDDFTVMDSFESLSEILFKTYEKNQIKKIYQIYLERLNSLKANVPEQEFKNLGWEI